MLFLQILALLQQSKWPLQVRGQETALQVLDKLNLLVVFRIMQEAGWRDGICQIVWWDNSFRVCFGYLVVGQLFRIPEILWWGLCFSCVNSANQPSL